MKTKRTSFQPIDLKPYMNMRVVFNPKKGDKIEGINGDGLNELDFFPFGQPVLKESGVPYVFGRTDEKRDVVVCDSQRLAVEKRAYRKAHLTGFMFWGGKFDYLTLSYADGTEERVKFFFSDWSRTYDHGVHDVFMYGEYRNVRTFGLCVSCCNTPGGFKGAVVISEYACPVRSDKILEAIVLPDNLFAHIFALTLEEADQSEKPEKTKRREQRRVRSGRRGEKE